MITLTHKLWVGVLSVRGENEMDIYAYQRPLGRIADDEKLRNRFIEIYDAKTHQQIVQFCRNYGRARPRGGGPAQPKDRSRC